MLAVGVPRFFPVTTFGADRDGNTYGAWVTVLTDRTVAVLSLGSASRCNLKWEPTAQAAGPGYGLSDEVMVARVTNCPLAGSRRQTAARFARPASGASVQSSVKPAPSGNATIVPPPAWAKHSPAAPSGKSAGRHSGSHSRPGSSR